MYGNGDEKTNGELFLYKFLESKCNTIFDVGAWENPYYIMNERITFHLFEPYPPVFENLSKRIEGRKNIIANNTALGSEKVTIPFYYKYGMSFVNRSGHGKSDLFIETDTIDNYIKIHDIAYVDFVKIDTEGWELPIIKGAIGSLDKISHIQFEFGGTWNEGGFMLKEANDILSSHGFELFIIVPNGIVKITDFNNHSMYCNYFSTRKIENVQPIIL